MSDATHSAHASRRSLGLGAALLALGAVAGLIEPAARLFRRIPLNYNEGWNAFWADAALNGTPLYDSANELVSNNYPPLSFYVVGWAGHGLGDNVIAGRLIALASLILVTVCVARWLRAAGAERIAAFIGASFCLYMLTSYGDDYVAMNDPQMLGHALMMVGLVVPWRSGVSRAGVALCAALMLLGGFTKHLLIPLPAAVTVWLLLYRRSRLAAWVVSSAVGLALAFGLAYAADAAGFLTHLSSPREYSLDQALAATLEIAGRLAVVFALAAYALVSVLRSEAGRDRQPLSDAAKFVLLYLAFALVIGVAVSGGAGVVRNAFFDLVIAVSLGVGLGVDSLIGRSLRYHGGRLASGAVLVLGLAVALHAATKAPDTVRSVARLDEQERDTLATVQMIAQLGEGRAACETLQLCYWARGGLVMDFFNYGQKLKTGAASPASCTEALRRGDFPVLQLESVEDLSVPRLGSCGLDIERYYSVAFRSAVGTVLVPKGAR